MWPSTGKGTLIDPRKNLPIGSCQRLLYLLEKFFLGSSLPCPPPFISHMGGTTFGRSEGHLFKGGLCDNIKIIPSRGMLGFPLFQRRAQRISQVSKGVRASRRKMSRSWVVSGKIFCCSTNKYRNRIKITKEGEKYPADLFRKISHFSGGSRFLDWGGAAITPLPPKLVPPIVSYPLLFFFLISACRASHLSLPTLDYNLLFLHYLCFSSHSFFLGIKGSEKPPRLETKMAVS